MATKNTQKGDSPPLHAKGMFLPSSGIDPSLARATKPAPGLLFISMPQKRPLVAVLNERAVEKGEELGCGFGKSGKSSNFAVQNINIV